MFWSPGEISKSILRGVSTRQITDLAERGLVRPVKETSGKGVPRFYDLNGVLDIAVASSLRGLLPPYLVGEILKILRERLEQQERGEIDDWDLLIIKRSAKGGRLGTAVVSFEDLDSQLLRWVDEKETSNSKALGSRRERIGQDEDRIVQMVPLNWEGEEIKRVASAGVCDPTDHRVIILNITDLRGEISAAIG